MIKSYEHHDFFSDKRFTLNDAQKLRSMYNECAYLCPEHTERVDMLVHNKLNNYYLQKTNQAFTKSNNHFKRCNMCPLICVAIEIVILLVAFLLSNVIPQNHMMLLNNITVLLVVLTLCGTLTVALVSSAKGNLESKYGRLLGELTKEFGYIKIDWSDINTEKYISEEDDEDRN